ncbi:hypothetical protein QN277_017059 [Acacia crassicarpa]|uniref:60S ribosomal protein L41 n=1 Tax=Acacia crassicarpa TaxID=499986 RepID=A0AAE1JN58_9FABA|nr:hypothetical protein QN277_017059 [Acacia crassicarpa]
MRAKWKKKRMRRLKRKRRKMRQRSNLTRLAENKGCFSNFAATLAHGRLKRKLELESRPCIMKKLRSMLYRRRRCQISPVLLSSKKFKDSDANVISMDSSTCSRYNGKESCDSTRISVDSWKNIINKSEDDLPKDKCKEFWRI